MKVTIIVDDNSVYVDGEHYDGVDLSFITDKEIHAIQWYDTYGEIEMVEPGTNNKIANIKINDFSPYQQAIDNFNTKKQQVALERAAKKL